jgi:type VI secretion system VasD/TssJ family lipoprotein
MKGSPKAWLPALLALSLVSCATTEWRYEKDAIRLHLVSDRNLNLFGGIPHTLLLCVYHLRDPNAFNQAMDEKDGLVKLLECVRFDPSVTYTKRIIVQPGQEVTESLDRAEGARYVGLVAGYSQLQKERVARFYEIPVGGLSKSPQRLDIDLYLGPQELQEPRGKK